MDTNVDLHDNADHRRVIEKMEKYEDKIMPVLDERAAGEGLPDELARARDVVAAGDALIQPSVMRRLVETFVAARPRAGWGTAGRGDALRAALATLTDREREILMLAARGLSNDEIAADLVISPATVKTHLARVMAKTDAHDRAQLVVFAYESGLIAPSPR